MSHVYQFKDFEGSSHRILLELIRKHARGSRLLDLGAAGGELGAALSHDFEKRVGFEFDAGRIGDLHERFDSAVIANLEQTYRLPRMQDAIVLADVLEHVRGPRRILAMVRDSLAPTGTLFVSVPNVANFSVRFSLLLGVFRYAPRGILDETHIRFYTPATIREEVEAAGFEIIETRASSVPIRLVLEQRLPNAVIRAGERILSLVTPAWKSMLAYQVILVARKRA